jgi:flavin reductase (DIM6/NTAB) family NADH-FMN oxidoreductase RutF
MEQVRLDARVLNYPMPVALLGTKRGDKINFMAVAWLSMASYNPPRVVVSLGPHYSRDTIQMTGVFSLSFPSTKLLQETDFCGLVSGGLRDKTAIFKTFYGELGVPLIEDCPLTVECRVINPIVPNGSNISFFADIVAIYAKPTLLDEEGHLDLAKAKLFLLSQNDRRYYALGDKIGEAWKDGLKK